MTTTTASVAAPARPIRAISYALSALPVLFLTVDAIGKLVQPPEVVESFATLGFPVAASSGLGVLLLACVALSLVPRTAVLGAILLTAFLGGAVAVHVRVDNPLWTHTLFPTSLAAMAWAGLALREPRLRALLWRR